MVRKSMTGSLAFTIRILRMSRYIFHMCIMWCSVCPFAEMACKSCIGLWVTKYRNTLLIPLGTHLKGSGPTSCSYKPGGFGKSLQNELGQVKIVHTKWWRFVQEKAETQHNICRFQSSILFWIWALLACLEPEHQKGHHFVGTCSSAFSLHFPHSALNCL